MRTNTRGGCKLKYYQLIGITDEKPRFIEAPFATRYERQGFGPFDLYIFKGPSNTVRICSAKCGLIIAVGSTVETAQESFEETIREKSIHKIKERIDEAILQYGHAPGHETEKEKVET